MTKLIVALIAILVSLPALAAEWSSGPLPDGPQFAPGKNPPGATKRVEDRKEKRGIKTQGLTKEIVAKILEKKAAAGCPRLPDLDISYIERTPRFRRYNVSYEPGGKNPHLSEEEKKIQRWPLDGETVTFWGHVANKGLVESKPSTYRFYLDGKTIAEGELPAIQPCDQQIVTVAWPWQSGRHKITLQVDLNSENSEVTKTNNTLMDYTDAYTFFWTVRDLVYIQQESLPNNYGSYSCEDWHRSVMDWMNDRFAKCIYPSTPNGIPARVRIEYLWISEKPWEEHDAHTLSKFTDGTWPHYPGGRVDLATATDEQKKKLFADIEGTWKKNHLYDPDIPGQDRGLPHELSHQLGLIDLYHFNVPARLCQVKTADGKLLKEVYPEKAERRTWIKGLMSGGMIPQVWSESSAIALNMDYGRRRGYFGDYLLDLPKDCIVQILDARGMPIPGADIRVYHREGEAVPDVVKHRGTTDKKGMFSLGARPVGDVHVVGVNASLLIRVEHPKTKKVDWVWTDIVKFILAKHTEKKEQVVVEVPTGL